MLKSAAGVGLASEAADSTAGQKLAVLLLAEVRDVPALRRIRHDAIVALAAVSYGADGALEWASSAATDRELRAVEDHVVTVVEVSGAPVGWVERHDDCVHGLYVDPDRATQGVGRLLMSHAAEQIRPAGFGSVVLHVRRNAERFYLACGFKRTGEVASDLGLPMIKWLG